MVTPSCPAPETLIGFAAGDLPDEQIESVADHLESCPACEDTVALFEASPDTFVGKLREPDTRAHFAGEPEFQQAVALANDLAGEEFVDGKSPQHDLPQPQLDQLREYRLLEKLGEGGMGTVYKARHSRLNRLVALKMLPASRVAHGPSVARFAREIEAIGKLDHPNIVRAFDAGEDDAMHYLVMELVDGIDLHRLVKQLGSLSVADACEIVRQAALGLQHAHEHCLVHRDVKPSNLLLSRDGTVKVLDLGLALLQGEPRRREELTTTGQVMGTLDYIAPEQASDSHQVDIRADVYSLGCTLFKLLTGRAPFAGNQHDTALKKLMAHAQMTPPALQDHRADASGELAKLLKRMLAKDPNRRPATPVEVAVALEPIATGADLSALAEQVKDLPGHIEAASAEEIPVMVGKAGNGMPGVFKREIDHFGQRAWLWLGWALIATAFVCLGLTIASMTTAYEMTAELGGSASGLAHGVFGSLRYMKVGGPSFFAGVIVLIVAFVRMFSEASFLDRKYARGRIARIAVVLLVAGMVLGQVVVRLNHQRGKSTQVTVPEGSQIEVDSRGQMEITLPESTVPQEHRETPTEVRVHDRIPSPDGTMIAYAKPDEDGDTEIFVARQDGSDVRQLTDNDSVDIQPDWSPDGKQIAFASTRQGTWQVYVMDRDGSNFKNVSEQSVNAHTPKFGPDRRIAFVSYKMDMGRFLEVDLKMTVAGGPEKIVAANTPIAEFAWHPNGKFLVYTTSETPNLPGRIVFYRPDDETSKVVLYTVIDKRLQFHHAHDIGWHVQTNSIQLGAENFQANKKTDWITCRITPSHWGPASGGLGALDKGETYIISPHGEAHLIPLDRTSPAAVTTTPD